MCVSLSLFLVVTLVLVCKSKKLDTIETKQRRNESSGRRQGLESFYALSNVRDNVWLEC